MGTNCMMKVKGIEHTIYLWKHYDGYPSGILGLLYKTHKQLKIVSKHYTPPPLFRKADYFVFHMTYLYKKARERFREKWKSKMSSKEKKHIITEEWELDIAPAEFAMSKKEDWDKWDYYKYDINLIEDKITYCDYFPPDEEEFTEITIEIEDIPKLPNILKSKYLHQIIVNKL